MLERSLPDNEPTTPTAEVEEQPIENKLRPTELSDFVGQNEVKEHLSIFIEAAKKRGESLDHVLLYGNPGLGKTTLAHVIAKETGGQIRVTSGPALERVGDLAAILSNLKEGDILFIDEIHRLNKLIEEVLYPAMEDGALDIVVGKGPTARTLRLNLERFTLIGATTRLSLLSSPLRDRFGSTFHLNFYGEDEMTDIVKRSASILDVHLDNDAAQIIATRARKTPRIANRLLKQIRDFAQVKSDGTITQTTAEDALTMLGIDELGLSRTDRHILSTLITQYANRPVGIKTLAAACQEEVETIEDVHEPYLIQIGLIERTPRGRQATPRAHDHLN